MAVADLIGAAVGVILLVMVAYLLVGSVISTAQIVTSAQKSATLLEEQQLKTDITISNAAIIPDSYYPSDFNCTINNTGNMVISDFTHMDVLVYDNGSSSNIFTLYPYNPSSGNPEIGTWTIINNHDQYDSPQSELYPGNSYIIEVMTTGSSPHWFQITTGNGVYASTFLP
jgi:flagellar protein FlaF